MSTQVVHLRQYRDPEQVYWGIAHPYRMTITSWLQYRNLTYIPFYTSFLNWTIKLATRYRRTTEPTARPAEVRIRDDLRSRNFDNPFYLVEILEHFRTKVYRGRPMQGWIKDHNDDKQWKSAMRQLWHLLYDRPRSAREPRGPAREGQEVDDDDDDDEQEDGKEEDRGGVQVNPGTEQRLVLRGGRPAREEMSSEGALVKRRRRILVEYKLTQAQSSVSYYAGDPQHENQRRREFWESPGCIGL